MKPERWRLFVAVPIGEELRHDLAAAVEEWKRRPDLAGLRWTDPENWHVTLAFLGSVDVTMVPEIGKRLWNVCSAFEPLRLRSGGVGGFPTPKSARIAWYGIADERGALGHLAASVHRSLGVAEDKPFRAHITLARASQEPVNLRDWNRSAAAPCGELPVTKIQLVRSHTQRGAAQYEPLVAVPLGAVGSG